MQVLPWVSIWWGSLKLMCFVWTFGLKRKPPNKLSWTQMGKILECTPWAWCYFNFRVCEGNRNVWPLNWPHPSNHLHLLCSVVQKWIVAFTFDLTMFLFSLSLRQYKSLWEPQWKPSKWTSSQGYSPTSPTIKRGSTSSTPSSEEIGLSSMLISNF